MTTVTPPTPDPIAAARAVLAAGMAAGKPRDAMMALIAECERLALVAAEYTATMYAFQCLDIRGHVHVGDDEPGALRPRGFADPLDAQLDAIVAARTAAAREPVSDADKLPADGSLTGLGVGWAWKETSLGWRLYSPRGQWTASASGAGESSLWWDCETAEGESCGLPTTGNLDADKRACENALRERGWYGLTPLKQEPSRPGWRRNPDREGVDWDEAWVHTSGVQVLHDAVSHDWQAWTAEDRRGVFKPFGRARDSWENAARDAMELVNVPAAPERDDPHGLGVDTAAMRAAWDFTTGGGGSVREGVIAMILEYHAQTKGGE